MNLPEATVTHSEHVERPHAERSASQLGSLALCPGFRPDKNGKVHWVTAQGLRGHVALDEGDEGGLQSSFEERLVRLCQRYEENLPEAAVEYREIKLVTIERRWGYVDLTRIRKALLENGRKIADLVDYKFVKAKEVADAEINLQGKDYVVGMFDDERFVDVDEIHVHFLMPRFGTVTTAVFRRGDVPALKLEIISVLTQAKRTDTKRFRGATLTPHFDVCRFCGAKASCRALRKIADEIARKYDPEGYGRLPPLPENTHASEITDPKVLGQLRMLSTVMDSWAKAVQHHTLAGALDGNIPEGYAIDYRKGRRKLANPAGLLVAGMKFGLTTQDILDAADISFPQLEQKVKDAAPRGKKDFTANAFLDACRDLDVFESNPETPSLVRRK
jgi:hypothetical protein